MDPRGEAERGRLFKLLEERKIKLVNGLDELYERRQAEYETIQELERDVVLLVEQAQAIAEGK